MPCTRKNCSACKKKAPQPFSKRRCQPGTKPVGASPVGANSAPTGSLPQVFLADRGSGETVLPPGLVNRHCHGVGQVQAATALAHRQAQTLVGGQGVQYLARQATAFRAAQECIAGDETGVMKRPRSPGGEGEPSRMTPDFPTAGQGEGSELGRETGRHKGEAH